MLPIRTILQLSAVFMAGLVAYIWIGGITDHDIYAFHKTEFSTPDKLIAPGTIVAVSKRGRVSEICSLQVAEKDKGTTQKAIYYNRLREEFPSYVRSIRVVTYLFGDPEKTESLEVEPVAKMPKNGRTFEGQEIAITNLMQADKFLKDDCEEEMAWHISRGYKACTVRKVLNEHYIAQDGSIQRRTVAVAFAEHSNIVGQSTFMALDIPYSDTIAKFNGSPCDGDTLTAGAKIRRALDAIDRYSPT